MNEVECNGVGIVRTPGGIAVGVFDPNPPSRFFKIEVDYYGRRLKEEWINPRGLPWRDYFPNVDMLALGVRVRDGDRVLAELPPPPAADVPVFMVRSGPQVHVTESSVSVPPALLITDPVGDMWTLGLVTADPDDSPRGEFAFDVLRNGLGMGVIASRIEIRNGQVRAFTRKGWCRWLGREWS